MTDLIRQLELGSTEVADALGKRGAVPDVFSVNPGLTVAGPVFPVYAVSGTNWHFHKQIQTAPRDSIVYVYDVSCRQLAVFGGLVSDFLFLHRRIKGIVANCYIRDVGHIRKKHYPVWCLGFNTIGCVNTKIDGVDPIWQKSLDRRLDGARGVMVCDDTGVVLIPQKELSAVEDKLRAIKAREEEWFAKLDVGKTTFEIVCQPD